MNKSVKQIRTTLKDAPPGVQRNGEGLIMFMKKIMGASPLR